jgi:bis(5'-nucleosidyl)-tetraphosphatase
VRRPAEPFRPDRPLVAEVAAGAVLATPISPEILLIHQRSDDRWCFPKGHVEGTESAIDAARREVTEETGLTGFSLEEELLSVTYRFYNPNRDRSVVKTSIYFLGFSPRDEAKLEAGFDEFRWVRPSAAYSMVAFDLDRDVIAAAEQRLTDRGGVKPRPR